MKTFLKVDLHIHSSHSFDSQVSPKDIVDAAVKRKLDVIGVTDHGTINGGIETLKLARGKVRVLVGQETKTRQGDILVFNVEENIEQGQDIVKTCRHAENLGGVIIVPHPFDPLRQVVGKDMEKIVKYVQGIEGFNPRCFFERSNRKAEEFASANNLPAIASSDAHRKEDIGMAYTKIRGKDVFKAIVEGDVEMVKKAVGKRGLIKRKVKKTVRKR